MITHGLSHVAFAGIALGLVLNFLPLIVSLIVCVLGSLYILKLKRQTKLPGEICSGYSQQCRHGPGYFLSVIKNEFRRGIDGLSFGVYSGHLAG